MGWYEHRPEPALFRSITPAWRDEKLLELATQIRTRMFLAHVRAGTGTPIIGKDIEERAFQPLRPVAA